VIADVPIELRCDDPVFTARLAAAFRGFATGRPGRPAACVDIYLDEGRGVWRDDSAEPRVRQRDDRLLIEHRDLVATLTPGASRMVVTQPRRIISTENALRMLLALALARRGGLLLHAAGIVRGAGATVLFGRSGSGKSTSARLARGRPVLGDDLVALTKGEGGWRAHSAPFGGHAARRRRARSAPLGGLLRLRHGAAFELRPLGPAAAVSELLQSTVLPAAEPRDRAAALALCADLAGAAGVRELRFPVDHALWRWLGERGL
jgi:hypothetical protein